MYDPQKVKNVYCLQCFWSDKWDETNIGRDFDFKRPFFEQWKELFIEAPKVMMMNDDGIGSVNCEYTTDFAKGKNCYMVLSSWYDENCMFGFQINHDKSCVDNIYVNYSELMYDSVGCERCYKCEYCQYCQESNNCIFGFDLKNCSECLFCAGLRGKQYNIWNKQLTKEEYFEAEKALELGSWSNREKYKKEFAQWILHVPRKYANLVNCEDCTGDILVESKNAKECFYHSNLYFCKFMTNGDSGKYSYDCNSTGNPELCYECMTPDDSYQVIFSVNCWKSQFVSYSDNCHSSQNLFGCVGMKRKKYCVLNKQYTKEEYEELVPKIIEHMSSVTPHSGGEWGKFFSPNVSVFAYNESAANEWFPRDNDAALKLGSTWMEATSGSFGKETVKWENVPDNISEIGKNVLNEIFACKDCGKNYRIIESELEFYKKNEIPLPRYCIDCRHLYRKSRINPKKLWGRKCAKCGVEIQSTYAPGRPEILCCEECYMKEIY